MNNPEISAVAIGALMRMLAICLFSLYASFSLTACSKDSPVPENQPVAATGDEPLPPKYDAVGAAQAASRRVSCIDVLGQR